MTLTKTLLATAISAAALMAATSASAATYMFTAVGTNLTATGTFVTSNTALANGGFTITNTTGTVTFTNGNSFAISGPNAYLGADNVLFANRPNQYLSLDGTSFSVDNNQNTNFNLYYSAGYQYIRSNGNGSGALTSFTITPAVAAVPETATWGMMILGFGMIGAAARSRKVKMSVNFA